MRVCLIVSALLLTCCVQTPPTVSPPVAAAQDQQLDAAVLPSPQEAAKHNGYEVQLGSVIEIEKDWKVDRNQLGVVLGRWKRIDALAKGEDKCWVVHFSVRQDFDGQGYLDTYTASVTMASPGPWGRHVIDCAGFR